MARTKKGKKAAELEAIVAKIKANAPPAANSAKLNKAIEELSSFKESYVKKAIKTIRDRTKSKKKIRELKTKVTAQNATGTNATIGADGHVHITNNHTTVADMLNLLEMMLVREQLLTHHRWQWQCFHGLAQEGSSCAPREEGQGRRSAGASHLREPAPAWRYCGGPQCTECACHRGVAGCITRCRCWRQEAQARRR